MSMTTNIKSEEVVAILSGDDSEYDADILESRQLVKVFFELFSEETDASEVAEFIYANCNWRVG